jgi:hypothetical protein
VSWSSKRQAIVSRSSAEAEYRGVANATAECCWLLHLLGELHIKVDKATLLYCDNVSAVYLTDNPIHHGRTKHIDLMFTLSGKKWSLVNFGFAMFRRTCRSWTS